MDRLYSDAGFQVYPSERTESGFSISNESGFQLTDQNQSNPISSMNVDIDLKSLYTDSTIQETKNQVDQVVGIMKSNLNMVVQRETNLGRLESGAVDLSTGALSFQKKAVSLQRKLWWYNARYKIFIAGLILVIIILLLIRFLENSDMSSDDDMVTLEGHHHKHKE